MLLPIQRAYYITATGLAIILLISMWVAYNNIQKLGTLPKLPCILLGIIVVLAVLVPGSSTYAKMYIVGLYCTFMTVYFLGIKVLTPLGLSTIIGSISVFVIITVTDFTRNGGVYQAQNYNLATGAIIFGAILWRTKYQWLVISLAMLASLLTGAEEAIVINIILISVALIRRDWSKKILPLTIGLIILSVAIIIPLGNIRNLWKTTPERVEALSDTLTTGPQVTDWSNGRLNVIFEALKNTTLFGHGYQPDNVGRTTIHNVPLRILYELGPIGLISWIGLIIYGIWKTTWKYAFIAVIAMSVFDHFIWTQLSPYSFVLLGASSYLSNTSDRIFSK